MSTQRVVLTVRDYEATPADGRHYQILDGELFVTASPTPIHQLVVGNLYVLLRRHVDDRRMGTVLLSPIAVILADTTVVEPDLVYLDAEQRPLISRRGIEGAPRLLIEVLSPSTKTVDQRTKSQLYARYGVSYYWIVDATARTIDAYELADGTYRTAARLSGSTQVALPPFADLALAPETIWPA